MKIPIFKLDFDKKLIEEYKKKSEEILTSNRPIGENKYVREFEEAFANLVGAKYAVAVTNGTAAIELALRVINVKQKTVLLPSNTFIATAIAVINSGGRVGLLDIEKENFSIDPKTLEEEIVKRKKSGEEIGAVIVVYIGGIITKNIKKIKSICIKYKIDLIEDAAQGHCSELDGLRAGTIGKVGCFSFFPTKVMTTAEGGMLTTNSKAIYEKAKSLKNFGRDPGNDDLMIYKDGVNFKISEFTGLLGLLECGRVMKRIKKRNELARIYLKRLQNTSYIPVIQDKGLCSFYKMILLTSIDREWLRNYCKSYDITLTGEVYKVPIHRQPAYKKDYEKQSFPVTDYVCDNQICPPLYPELSTKEINYVCDILIKAEKEYEKKNS